MIIENYIKKKYKSSVESNITLNLIYSIKEKNNYDGVMFWYNRYVTILSQKVSKKEKFSKSLYNLVNKIWETYNLNYEEKGGYWIYKLKNEK